MAFTPDPDGTSEPPDVLLTRFPDNTTALIGADDMRATVQSLGSTDYWLNADIAALQADVAMLLQFTWNQVSGGTEVVPDYTATGLAELPGEVQVTMPGFPASPTVRQQAWVVFGTAPVSAGATDDVTITDGTLPPVSLFQPNGTGVTQESIPWGTTEAVLLQWTGSHWMTLTSALVAP
jgi:hypothetical protein